MTHVGGHYRTSNFDCEPCVDGPLRWGAGLFKFGIQFTLFAVLLYYLLAAPTDPLEVAARVLPLSSTARERTIAAFSGALRAVFLSSIKLVRARCGFWFINE